MVFFRSRSKRRSSHQQARTLFVQYFVSGEWLNNLFEPSSSLASTWFSCSGKTKRIVLNGNSSGKCHHRPFFHSVSSSRKVSSMSKLIDLFPVSKLRSVMMAVALRRYFQSPCFLSMVECQWSEDIDSVSFISNQTAASCLPWEKTAYPLQRLLAAKLPLLSQPEDLQDKLSEDKWIWSLQTVLDNCPLGVGVYGLTTVKGSSSSSDHSSNSTSITTKNLSSNESMKSSNNKVLAGRFFNRSFAATIGQRPEDLYQTSLDFGAVESFSPDTMVSIMSALNNGEGVQVIAAYNSNNSAISSAKGGSPICLSLQPVMDYRNRLTKAVCVPRLMPFCGPSDCAQDLIVAEHLALLLASAV